MTEQELIRKVADSYEQTGSFKKTAEVLHISTAKVRKALLTAGVWTNEAAEQIKKIREQEKDWTDQQIAAHLHLSVNAVQMYTPYKAGPYTGDGPSAERTAEYRTRNRNISDNPDPNRKEMAVNLNKTTEKMPSVPQWRQPKNGWRFCFLHTSS